MPNYFGLTYYEDDPEREKKWKSKTRDDLIGLRTDLAKHIADSRNESARAFGTVRIATWNIREFGRTRYGRRLDEAMYFLAEIISFFDVVALQEINRDTREFERLLRLLGDRWEYLMTDASSSVRANQERMVFLYNIDRINTRNVVGEVSFDGDLRLILPDTFDLTPRDRPEGREPLEITLPDGTDIALRPGTKIKVEQKVKGHKLREDVEVDLPAGTKVTLPDGAKLIFKDYAEQLQKDHTILLGSGSVRQFGKGASIRLPADAVIAEDMNIARTPYMVQFQSNWLKLTLCTVHIYYGDDRENGLAMARREKEIQTLTKAMAEKARSDHRDSEGFFILLGDFNIVGKSHKTMQALENNGFKVPERIRELPDGSNVKRDKFYDQMAIYEGERGEGDPHKKYTSVEVVGGGVFDFYTSVFRASDKEYFLERQKEVTPKGNWAFEDYRTYHMSDHLPMWIELRTDFADGYLESLKIPRQRRMTDHERKYRRAAEPAKADVNPPEQAGRRASPTRRPRPRT